MVMTLMYQRQNRNHRHPRFRQRFRDRIRSNQTPVPQNPFLSEARSNLRSLEY